MKGRDYYEVVRTASSKYCSVETNVVVFNSLSLKRKEKRESKNAFLIISQRAAQSIDWFFFWDGEKERESECEREP